MRYLLAALLLAAQVGKRIIELAPLAQESAKTPHPVHSCILAGLAGRLRHQAVQLGEELPEHFIFGEQRARCPVEAIARNGSHRANRAHGCAHDLPAECANAQAAWDPAPGKTVQQEGSA